MRKWLFQITSQQMFLKTGIFIIACTCLVTVKVLIVLSEIEFMCMIFQKFDEM